MKKFLLLISLFLSLASISQVMRNVITQRHQIIQSPILNGLVAAYKMDESSGNIIDYSGNGNTGTANGSLTYSQTGIVNTAIQFDGSTSYFDAGNTSSLSLTTSGSISLWISVNYSGSFTYMCPISKGDGGGDRNGYNLMLYYNAGSSVDIAWELADASAADFNGEFATINPSTLYHLAVTWDGTTIKSFYNGSLLKSIPQTVTPLSNVYNFYLGRNGNSPFYFNGLIDEVYIFNRALTTDGIDTLYNSGAGKSYPFTKISLLDNNFSMNKPIKKSAKIIEFEKYFADNRIYQLKKVS